MLIFSNQTSQLIDENKNQSINFEEFSRVFDRLQPRIQNDELQNLFNDINLSRSKSITYNEFLNYMTVKIFALSLIINKN